MSAVIAPPKEKKSKSKSKDKSSKRKEKEKQTSISNHLVESGDEEFDERNATNDGLVPPGAVLLDNVLDVDEFDYERLKNDDDLELCVIRIPNGIKPKFLQGMQANLLSTASMSSTSRIGALTKKSGEVFDLWNIHPDSEGTDANGGPVVGGEELVNLTCLVPNKSKGGKLFIAPKPIKHHLLLSSRSSVIPPLPTSTSNPTSGLPYKSPARYQHPKSLLKHRFLPTGAALVQPQPPTSVLLDQKNSMEVDPGNSNKSITEESPKSKPEKVSVPDGTKRKEKKRKAEGDPGKSKKAKTANPGQ